MVIRSALVPMWQDQRQNALSDAAETDKHDTPREIHVNLVLAHDVFCIDSVVLSRTPVRRKSAIVTR